MKQRLFTYGWLLSVNLFISTFTFGGGYVVVPMIRRFFVEKKQCFSETELMNMAAIAQSAPGAIAINLSALAGYRTAGIGGAFISCFAAILPPLIILAFVSAFYQSFISNPIITAVLKGMEVGVAALMVDLIIDMCTLITKQKSMLLTAMVPLSFLAAFCFRINAAIILCICALLSVLHIVWQRGNSQ